MSSSNPGRMDAPDEWFGSAGSPSARFAGDADHFHHGARRSVSAPDRSRCGSFRLSHKTFRRRDSSGARSESDVALRAVPRFGASAATFRSRLFFSLYIEERQKQETSREHRLAGPVNSRKTNVSRIIASVTATAQGTSTFVEYKYLDYVALDVGNGNH